uniref:Uncharacterized protein n=1 Tax=Arion vulgaris TaxID=1028688 RepID=A0A0B7AXG6_9EUPU
MSVIVILSPFYELFSTSGHIISTILPMFFFIFPLDIQAVFSHQLPIRGLS